MSENEDTYEKESDFNPAKRFMEMRENARIGSFPGAGPSGAQQLSYEQLPDDPEALKQMYLELQRTIRDNEARHHREKEQLRWGGEDTLEDLLSRFWWRAWELIFIVGVLAVIIPILTSDIFSETQQTVGVVLLTALWERYLRKPIHSIGQAVEEQLIP